MSIRSNRKEEHLALAQEFFDANKKNNFDQMHLLRPALPESKAALATIKTSMFGKSVNAPFFINAMTGGSPKSLAINRTLGQIAGKTKIALALGSASILVKEPDQLASFYVAREANPDGVIIVNVNALTKPQDAQKIVTELSADALQIHLNTVQEIAMPEGDRDFYWLDNLKQIRQTVTVPIIIKEVGFGLDAASIRLLKESGFNLFDLAGSGGTNFAQIENARNNHDVSYLADIGLPTVVAAKMAVREKTDFIVSGGIRNPLDIFKGLCLGGKYVGIANTFLQSLQEHGSQYLLELIESWQEELANLLAIYGQHDLNHLTELKQYYDLPLKSLIEQLL
ncbi:type 2 isopentenyl-diphosphate Delta-isomerase [Lactobacillus sp. ESL0681]|uniref:type 2 isopentenyl-diphosphate Delta-isomerase n=1 Tax=Lactobacillus sp. ESL0681 TaxID=2983211 RepID=UPI0023F9F7A9|nr:type 2 isopentenyl-diphosphate Delta-isomerase [Lactobacillus sp. ESL0681]WEV40695.1 type 2 isopentenyl-diphosphate Delta-isomerase [Lactobacillus sp. ESL0681]